MGNITSNYKYVEDEYYAEELREEKLREEKLREEELREEKQYAKEQLDIYNSFLEDEYLELCDEVHKYRFTHKTQIIRDRTLLFKLQDNAIRRNCYFLNKSLAINLNKKQNKKNN